MTNLQTLSFDYCDNLKFLFSGVKLPSLEALIVQSCRSLESLPLLDILPKLEALLVKDCEMLTCSLKQETLITDNKTTALSMKDESPIQRLRMKFLHLEYFPGLARLPTWIKGTANTLQNLIIYIFPNLGMLPEYLSRMTHLKGLHIVDCPRVLFPQSLMHRLTTIEDLRVSGCPAWDYVLPHLNLV
ncbi:hypothetical protein RJT34_20379 [Clitoria ternatea]|uniref:Uncharacterized protein n=1 Tax=Clitoria ternatea TaxID=43366 RepID=A0AAN9P4V1_CLITE